jgi:hypothetical protein
MRAVRPVLIFTLLHGASSIGMPAQSDRKPRVEVISVQPALLTQDGLTVGETEVTYRVEFIPRNATHAELQLLRDSSVVGSFAAPMKAGLNTVRLPSGIQMENPRNHLRARLTLPDGRLSEASVVTIYEREDFEHRDRALAARFDRVEPDLLVSGRDHQLTVHGAQLAVVADRMTVNGMTVPARLVAGALQLRLPRGIFQLPGFVTVEPRADSMNTPVNPNQRLRIAIADPALPAPGGLRSPRIDAVEYVGSEYGERLEVRGFGFRPQQKIVIGRGRTPIQAQDAEMRDQRLVSTWVPAAPPANDYFIAVLAADGKSMTRPFPIPSPDEMRAAAVTRPQPRIDEPALTAPGFRVFGDLAWNTGVTQFVMLEGPVAKPGLRVTLEREGPPITVETLPAGPEASNRRYPVVRVPVSPELTTRARFDVRIIIHTK